LTTDDQNDRPQGQFTHFGKISNGHNSATRQPIPSMFGSRVEFSGMADRTAPFPVGSNPRWPPADILENFKRPYLSDASSDRLRVRGWGFRGRRIEKRHFRFSQIQDGRRRPSGKTSNSHISAMHCPIHCMYADHTLPSVSNL